jgi:hypothetical protein
MTLLDQIVFTFSTVLHIVTVLAKELRVWSPEFFFFDIKRIPQELLGHRDNFISGKFLSKAIEMMT